MNIPHPLPAAPDLDPQVRRLALIPARGGSKGLPRKNVLDLAGQPLIAYTIRSALACGGFDRVVVSTDDEEIAETSRAWGAVVPALRPRELAQDTSLLCEARKHMLDVLQKQGESFHTCAELYPTSPFRRPRLLRELLARLDSGYQSVHTAQCYSLDRMRCYVATDGQAGPLRPRPMTAHTGMFLLGLFTGYWLRPTRPVWGSYVHHITDPAERVDIDSQADLDLARYILERNLYDFEA